VSQVASICDNSQWLSSVIREEAVRAIYATTHPSQILGVATPNPLGLTPTHPCKESKPETRNWRKCREKLHRSL